MVLSVDLKSADFKGVSKMKIAKVEHAVPTLRIHKSG